MKQCPICGATSFDDAPVCYGCLFDYAKQGQGVLKGIDADQKVGVVSAPSVSQPGSGLFAEGEHAWGEALVFRMAASAPHASLSHIDCNAEDHRKKNRKSAHEDGHDGRLKHSPPR